MTKTDTALNANDPIRVVALIYDGLCTFEYGIVAEIFGLRRPELGRDLYGFISVAIESGPIHAAGGLMVQASGTRADLARADIIVVPGWRGKDEPVPHEFCDDIRAAYARGARLLSICSGVYVLAAAGLLTARKATTHWRYTQHLAQKYPQITVLANELYVDEGQIITSAGSSAGIDACLHIVRKDYGAKIANSVARRLVMHAHRQGGQAQFIEQPVAKLDGKQRLSDVMDAIRERLSEAHQIETMAQLAGMSSRTFQRRFFALTGLPVMRWLTQERVAKSCQLLETSDLPVESIGEAVGFGNADAMRYHFRQALAVSPNEYRKRFSLHTARRVMV